MPSSDTDLSESKIIENGSVTVCAKSRGTHFTVYLYNEIGIDSLKYMELSYLCLNAGHEDLITVLLDSPGGSCSTADTIINAFKSSSARIEMVVMGECASAAAIISLCGDSLRLMPGTTLMFHNFSSAPAGKARELAHAVAENDLQYEYMLKHHCLPFLTEQEVKLILSDRDVYIHSWDKDLDKRLSRHFSVDKGEIV